ncbi:anthranilate synthase component II [Homoserinibacter sp. YIM 151385]|uniref:anthranilate synthase component II n=1 Tax=Homoserinibacter sp. YIM 151385 TaxID=2985506 RepID=UPI0022F07E9B|nr:gamma-glutamyl-gamma-aminobutyrate hydrolase family protein [Homoserinibacter sp. YIM 151385]WBU37224.1 gamma-glutamyl-gamma-aminobutyrate hydrolase family protein [Homoserinibacter sp. YIM 151385]
MTRVLVVDNDDSFVFTLVAYLRELGAEVAVRRSDAVEAGEGPAVLRGLDGILVSPGPGTPAAAGRAPELVRAALETRLPLLGVCLGHQILAEVLGARVGHAPELVHGMTSRVVHDGGALYAGIPSPFAATRYHSLAVEESSLPPELEVVSRTDGGVVMGVRHRELPAEGVQFHPEAVLTEGGHRLLGNWLEGIGLDGAAALGAGLSPRSR